MFQEHGGGEPHPENKENRDRKISLTFHFSSHRNKADIADLSREVENNDVIMLESFGWNSDEANFLKKASQGEISLDDFDNTSDTDVGSMMEYKRGLLEAIHGTKKPIILFDVPKDHERYNEIVEIYQAADKKGRKAQELFFEGKFEEFIEKQKENIDLKQASNELREPIMKENIQEEIENLRSDPRFKDRDKLNVMVHAGSMHRGVAHELQENTDKEEVNIRTRAGGFGINIYDRTQEIQRRMKSGKEAEDILYAKGFLEQIYTFHLMHPSNPLSKENSDKLRLVSRQLVDQFTMEDIKELCKQVGDSDPNEKMNIFHRFLTEKNKKYLKGLGSIPDEDEEVKRILKAMYHLWDKEDKVTD